MNSEIDFKSAKNKAVRFLMKQDIHGICIDVNNLKFTDKNVIISSIQNYSNLVNKPLSDFMIGGILETACTLKTKNVNIILYNDYETNKARKTWSICHEIGHVYMEHTKDGHNEEIEANFFASQIIMPDVVLVGIQNRILFNITYTDLMYMFDVSAESAKKRINTFSKLKSFRFTSMESALSAEFAPYMDKAVEGYFNSTYLKQKNNNTIFRRTNTLNKPMTGII